ncbi:MAG TPA: PAS domain S-box protein, partial [Thermodesulfovibrionales bacterium]|nr:PAS domain S-box protein [Thermodesulfovibrionales bacterium]
MDKKKKKTVKSPKVTSPEIASSDRQDKITVGAAQPSGSGICRDIKELEHTATELALSEQKFRNLAEGSPNMIFINHRGRIVYANIRCSEIMKYRPEEFYDQGFDFMTLVAPEYQDLVKANFRKHMAGEDVPPHEYALITKEGKRIDSIINTSLIDYEGGKAILGVVTDITERRNAENKLRESEDKFRALFESATDGILILDLEQEQFLDGNKAICSMLGYTIEEVRSLRVRDIHPKQDLPAVIGILERQIRGEITLAKDIPVLRKDGSVFYADINATHVVMAGRPCIAGLFRDITDRKLAEEALRESEEKFRALFESAKDGVILLSMNGDVLALNASFAKMHGYTTEEMLQMNLKDLDTPESAQLASARLQRLFAGEPLTFDVEHYCKNGQTIPLEVSANLVNVHGKKYILGFHRDVTDRRLSEAALIESEERYRNVYNTAPLAFVLWDRETRVTDWNEQAERIFGWTREEIIGRNFFDYIIPASAHLHVEEVVKLLLEGKLPSYSINENITKSGRIIVCEWNNSVIRDSGGNIVGVISLGLDISERKRAEEALKESEERFKA